MAIDVLSRAPRPHAPTPDGTWRNWFAHGGRPHWGKEHAVAQDYLEAVYPLLGDHLAVRADVDPSGTFLNPHVRQVLGL